MPEGNYTRVAGKYQNASEHMLDELALVGRRIERQLFHHWERGILPKLRDEFSGTFVSEQEVRAILAGHTLSPSSASRLRSIDSDLRAMRSSIDAKMAATGQQGTPLPMAELRDSFGLSDTQYCALWVLLAAEVNTRIRGLMRYLVNESSRPHTDLGLLEMLVYWDSDLAPILLTDFSHDSLLIRYQLAEFIGEAQLEDKPLLAWPVKVSTRLVELAHGTSRLDPSVSSVATLDLTPNDGSSLEIESAVLEEIISLARASAASAEMGEASPMMVLTGLEGSGRKALTKAAAAAIGQATLTVRCEMLPSEEQLLERVLRSVLREALLFRAVPVFENIDTLAADTESGRPNRARALDRIGRFFFGPMFGTGAIRDTRPVTLSRGTVVVDIPVPGENQRAVLWARTLDGIAPNLDVSQVAARYPITGGVLLRAARAASSLAAARGEPNDVGDSDIHVGLRSTLDSKLSNLGKRIEWKQRWEDLILPEDSIAEIREFMARIKHRRRVYQDWGFARKVAKGLGLSALFAGPPGTGKTMVAGLIASQLSLDLYQIDLSKIVSKYVGETEKNLAELFDAAEAGHAILLFDEADSLFAKRTEVKSSIDRYANLEVNYLLQRMESFSGITILTTNLDSSIDDAFRRRISFRVDFPFPEPTDRERLWQAMLPDEAAVSGDIDFEGLGDRFEMSGGYIRNAVLRAAFLAAAEDSDITMHHMKRAATLEYQAMGKVISHL